MDYRYADGTAFPIQINFIDFLGDAVDCAVQLLLIHQRGLALRAEQTDEQRRTHRSIENLVAVESMVVRTTDQASGVSKRVIERICEATSAIIQEEKVQLANQMAQQGADVERAASEEAGRVVSALEPLLRAHDLPGADVSINMELVQGGLGYRGRVLCAGALGIDAIMNIEVPAGHRFNEPVRVGDVVPVSISIPGESGPPSGPPRAERFRLDKYLVTEMVFSLDRATIGLRRKLSAPSEGFRIAMAWSDGLEVTVQRVVDGVRLAELPHRLPTAEAILVERLVAGLRKAVLALGRSRGRIAQATLDAAPIDGFDGAGEIARRLIAMLAPYVTEMARRGSAPGELALKRDLGDGRREEIYIPKHSLIERLRPLDPEARARFDGLELVAPAPAPAQGAQRTPTPPAVPATLRLVAR